jgi:hypothetical protein
MFGDLAFLRKELIADIRQRDDTSSEKGDTPRTANDLAGAHRDEDGEERKTDHKKTLDKKRIRKEAFLWTVIDADLQVKITTEDES